MNTKLGLHIAAGSRNGYNLTAPHSRGFISFFADAFLEANPDSFRVFRPGAEHGIYTWGSDHNWDIMPGFNELTIDDMPAQADYWWPKMRAAADAEEARLGVTINAIQPRNESDSDERIVNEKLIAYERALMQLAEADGRILVVGSLSTNSPHWGNGLWHELWGPFIQEAWARGHIYGRHSYFDYPPENDHKMRPFWEIDYLRTLGPTGPVIISEAGFVTFPGVNAFMAAIAEYDQLLQQYPEIGYAAIFTYGEWWNANIQDASAALSEYLKARPFVKWQPTYQPEEPPMEKHKAVVIKLPQTMTETEWLDACKVAYPFRHTVTASHDDMLTILNGGNADSYVKAAHPERDMDALALVEAAGYQWEPLYNKPPDNPFSGLKFGQPLDTAWVTVAGGQFNAPRNYSAFGGLVNDKHEGIDAAPTTTAVSHVLNVWPGIVEFIGSSAGYGNNVTIRHEYNGVMFRTRRAHMQSIGVLVGQSVGKGAILGICGSTGNSTGKHDHLTMTSVGHGMSGYIVADVMDPTPYYPAPTTQPPPTGETVNVRPFFEPVGDFGPYKVLSWLDGTKTQPQQILRRDGCILEAKGEGQWHNGKRYDDYERWRFVDGKMCRDEDTSQGWPDAYDQNGAQWLPEVCEIGKQYINQPRLSHYKRDTCQFVGDAITTDYLTVTKRHAKWPSPANAAIVIDDVIEIEWRKQPTGPVIERYFYGRGMGLVGWGVGSLEAAISELPQGRTPLNPQLWSCV